MTSLAGYLQLRVFIDNTPIGPNIDLGSPGRHMIRAYCKGRQEVIQRLSRESGFKDVEQWLLQVWPATVDAID